MKIKFHETGVSFTPENRAELSYLGEIRESAVINGFDVYDFDGRGFNDEEFGIGVRISKKHEKA